MTLTVMQILPALESGGVEQGTLEIAEALVAAGHRALVVSAGGRMVPRLEALGAEHRTLPVGRKNPLVFRHVSALRRLMREEGVDIVHPRSRLPAWVAWRAWRGLPAGARPRLVTTVHGFYSPGRYSSIMVRGERVIAVSESIRDYILEHYPQVDPGRITVIPRGIEPARYPYGYRPPADWLERWYREHPRLREALVLALPGRITRLKGHEDFIEIVARLRGAGVEAVGVIAGGVHPRKRRYHAELQRRIAERGLEGSVLFVGQRSDLREVLAVSDYVLSLSGKPESFGRTTLEALSMGVPVLGYAHGGVREQLERLFPEGAVPPREPEAVVARVLEWGRHPPQVREDNPFTLEAMQSRTLKLYEELADR